MGSVFPHFKIIFSLITEPLFFTPTWPTTIKGTLYQKLSYIYLKNRIFQPKTFLTLVWKNQWPGTLTSSTQKRNFYPKNFIWLPKKKQYFKQKFFYTGLKEPNFFPKKKIFILSWKKFLFLVRKKQIFQTKINSSDYREKIIRTNNFICLSEKHIFYIFGRNSKPFISDVFWIRLCYFFMLAN